MKKIIGTFLLLCGLVAGVFFFGSVTANEEELASKLTLRSTSLLKVPVNLPINTEYDSGINISYPKDGVKGIYVQAFRAEGEELQKVLNYIDQTPINSVVIDVRDGFGNITMPLDTESQLIKNHTTNEVSNPKRLLQTLEQHQIYPIARVVSFGDDQRPLERPDLTFRHPNGVVWRDGEGGTYLNPFKKENWEYVADVAEGAAKLGFKDIQLDFVRFPLGFENFEVNLVYDMEDYSNYTDRDEARIAAITDFIAYVRERLKPYGVHLSADIIAHAVTQNEVGGIGQRFTNIAEYVDVISPMIFPSHWANGSLGVERPDFQPYDLISNYMKIEQGFMKDLNPSPTSRPWIQAFTADFLGSGNFKLYTADVISQEIKALKDAGIHEYLLWNAATQYSTKIEF